MNHEQKALMDLWTVFARLCETHSLRYYLAGGSLLGAVRHRGFIPWDDDMDVMMPLADYRRFLRLCETLPPGILLQSEQNDTDYPFLFSKLCDTAHPFPREGCRGPKGIYIDIFPLYPSRAPSKFAALLFDAGTVVGYALLVKTGWTVYQPYRRAIARLGYGMLRRFSIQRLRRLRKVLVRVLSRSGTGYCVSPGGGHKGLVEFYPRAWFREIVWMEFEGRAMPAPGGWEAYLRQLYGEDWRIPEERRPRGHT